MYWQPVSNLYDEYEPVDPVYCGICKLHLRPTHYSNTELSQDFKRGTCSRCNIAIKLPCGHIVVDDCDSADLDGMSFHNETEWRRKVLSRSL